MHNLIKYIIYIYNYLYYNKIYYNIYIIMSEWLDYVKAYAEKNKITYK